MPGTGDTAIINSGTVNATNFGFTGVTVNLNGTTTAGGTLNLTGDTFDAASNLVVTDTGSFATPPTLPTLTINGTNTNNGTISFVGSTPTVTFGSGGSLINAGTINVTGSSPKVAIGSAAGSIVNNGLIQVTNASAAFQSALINANITGTGTISIAAHGALDLKAVVGSGQTVAFTGGANAGSALEIDAPTSYTATTAGFVSGDRLIVTSIPNTSYTYTLTGSSSGLLTLYSGATAQGSFKLSGIYSQSTFSVQANPQGSSGLNNVIITTSVINSTTGALSNGGNASTLAMYRFFDKVYGTHLFTADAGEVATIKATRGDLTEETNGFGSVSSFDPNAESVYRFFNLHDGTHFYTASQSEFVGLTTPGSATYRSDLSYEPNSTLYEHATQQAGDVAVYRLFDSVHGTQFLTGDQGEYNNITTAGLSTYRPDLKPEGVAFYAPTGSFFA